MPTPKEGARFLRAAFQPVNRGPGAGFGAEILPNILRLIPRFFGDRRELFNGPGDFGPRSPAPDPVSRPLSRHAGMRFLAKNSAQTPKKPIIIKLKPQKSLRNAL